MQRRFFSYLYLALILVIVSGFVWYNWQRGLEGGNGPSSATAADGDAARLKARVNVLLIGTDQRSGETKFNTDSLILASIDPVKKQISLLSIPRDTKVHLARYGEVKINSIASLESFDSLQKAVSDLLGVTLKGYIITNFAGFKQIIDTLGGVTVNVEKDMYYETGDKVDGYINLHKGLQRLGGTQALEYARFRHDALADISRTARQQAVLKAAAKEMFQLGTLPKLPVLIPELMKAVRTNLSPLDIFAMSKAVAGFDSSQVISQTLPGAFLDQNGISYWNVDPIQAKQVLSNLFKGITTDKVIKDTDVDLLMPVEPGKPVPVVPGSALDPNGQISPGHTNPVNGLSGEEQAVPGSENFGTGTEVNVWPLGPDGGA